MGIFKNLFKPAAPDPRDALIPLYNQIVAKARLPHWYVEGDVPDSVDGRFDMVATILSLVLLRLEPERDHAAANAFLTEIFVDDMDAQLREFGIGDMIVGKHVGKLMGALGGRLGALRAALAEGGDLDEFVTRNLYRGETVDAAKRKAVVRELRTLATALDAVASDALVSGDAPW